MCSVIVNVSHGDRTAFQRGWYITEQPPTVWSLVTRPQDSNQNSKTATSQVQKVKVS